MTATFAPDRVPSPGRAGDPQQLDLFVDTGDVVLVHEIVTGLGARDPERARAGLARLRDEHPSHPDLPALTLLAGALAPAAPASPTPAILTAGIDTMERVLVPAARRFLGAGAAGFLRPLWQRLASTAAGIPFDAAHPRAHPGWLHQQTGEWEAVRAAVEAEPGGAAQPCLRFWAGLAQHHLGRPEAAARLWLPLCWTAPRFFAEHAPALPGGAVRDGWETFDRVAPFEDWVASSTDAVSWFPAWLLAREWGLVRLFPAGEITEASVPARVFRALLSLLPLERGPLGDELVGRRRALRGLSPDFFRHYMDVVASRRPVS